MAVGARLDIGVGARVGVGVGIGVVVGEIDSDVVRSEVVAFIFLTPGLLARAGVNEAAWRVRFNQTERPVVLDNECDHRDHFRLH